MLDLAQTIRDEIERQELTQYRLVQDTGLNISTISAFIYGGDIRLATASKLCDYLGLELRPTKQAVKRKAVKKKATKKAKKKAAKRKK